MKKYAVLIGRFQPIHAGHIEVIKQALEQADELVICLGSHNESPNTRNPFDSIEREAMIRIALSETGIDNDRVHVTPVENYSYNDDRWAAGVNTAVTSVIWKKWRPDGTKLYFVGPKKENDPDLKNHFPTWDRIEIQNIPSINATDVRKQIFEDVRIYEKEYCLKHLAPGVSEFIKGWLMHSEVAHTLIKEYMIIKDYKKSWEPGGIQTFFDAQGNPVRVQVGPPYPAIFQTVDAVVTQSGHVLMVTRDAAPGEGLLALPGGFVNPSETLEDACIRELREETKIDVPDKVLKGSIKWNRSFDDPHRSSRGRTITQAYHIALEPRDTLPKVKGSDDARKAEWIPIQDLQSIGFGKKVFEDHLQIIRIMAGIS